MTDVSLEENSFLQIKLEIPEVLNPVHLRGEVLRSNKTTLEDDAPFVIGMRFEKIEEDNKNTFLKFLCDLLYGNEYAGR